jgi:hypothetical protein
VRFWTGEHCDKVKIPLEGGVCWGMKGFRSVSLGGRRVEGVVEVEVVV